MIALTTTNFKKFHAFILLLDIVSHLTMMTVMFLPSNRLTLQVHAMAIVWSCLFITLFFTCHHVNAQTLALDREFIQNTTASHRGHTRKIYIVNNIPEGGALKYIKDIQDTFSSRDFIVIKSKMSLQAAKTSISHKDVLIVNHFLHSGIQPEDIISIKRVTRVKLILVAHDFYMLHPKHGPDEPRVHGGYSLEVEHNHVIAKLFAICDHVVYPSDFSLQQFKKFYPHQNGMSLYPIDDVPVDTVVSRPIILSDRIINVGALYGLSVYKGVHLTRYLEATYPHYKGYKINFLVPGWNIPKYQESDKNEGFFSVVRKQRIHGLLYLSRWGETYSYTMTKYLGTGLPILYNNFGAFPERMNHITGKGKTSLFPVFQSEAQYEAAFKYIEELNKDHSMKVNPTSSLAHAQSTFEAFLDHIITNNRDQSYQFSTMRKVVDPQYEKILTPLVDEDRGLHLHSSGDSSPKNLVIVTSKLRVSEKPFSYVPSRSMYTVDERFWQTVATIKSIRKHIPNSYIALFDNSINVPYKYIAYLRAETDVFLDVIDDPVLNYYTDEYQYKAFAELGQMIKLYNVHFLDSKESFSNVFKISGRYTITDKFDFQVYNHGRNVFKRDETLKDMQYYYTCFYKIASQNFHSYFELLKKIFLQREEFVKKNILNLEEIIPRELGYDFITPPVLGLKQNVAVWNNTLEI